MKVLGWCAFPIGVVIFHISLMFLYSASKPLAIYIGYNKILATKVLEENDFSNISTGSHVWNACPNEYFYATRFIATNKFGYNLKGVVCSKTWSKEKALIIYLS